MGPNGMPCVHTHQDIDYRGPEYVIFRLGYKWVGGLRCEHNHAVFIGRRCDGRYGITTRSSQNNFYSVHCSEFSVRGYGIWGDTFLVLDYQFDRTDDE